MEPARDFTRDEKVPAPWSEPDCAGMMGRARFSKSHLTYQFHNNNWV